MNQQVKTGLGVAVIVIIAATAAFFTWKVQKNKQGAENIQAPAANVNQKTIDSTQSQQSFNNSDKSESIENQGDKIILNLPQSWGNLVVPQVNEFGHIISDNPYRSKNDTDTILFGGVMGENEFSKMISSYSYGNKKDYIEAPSISLAKYPVVFTDDESKSDFGYTTKKQKEMALQPLLDIFKKGNVDNIDLSQKCFLNADVTKCAASNLIGFWWGNIDCISDRIAVRYYENSNSDLRGIGYFDVSGQDATNTVNSYTIILINPQKRILAYLYLPLNGIYSFPSLTNRGVDNEEIDFKRAYDYLENSKNYKNTQLEQFMNEVKNIVSSMEIIS